MKDPIEISPGVDERVERLICRHLDGEITPAEQAELDRCLEDPAARQLMTDYRRGDSLALAALNADLASGREAKEGHVYRSLWVAAAGAVLAAAAVVVFSFIPIQENPSRLAHVAPMPSSPVVVPPSLSVAGQGQPVDYHSVDYRPQNRYGRVHRDLIGIQGTDKNVIYIFEREARSTNVVPISGDF